MLALRSLLNRDKCLVSSIYHNMIMHTIAVMCHCIVLCFVVVVELTALLFSHFYGNLWFEPMIGSLIGSDAVCSSAIPFPHWFFNRPLFTTYALPFVSSVCSIYLTISYDGDYHISILLYLVGYLSFFSLFAHFNLKKTMNNNTGFRSNDLTRVQFAMALLCESKRMKNWWSWNRASKVDST